jgi:hypothetical protein
MSIEKCRHGQIRGHCDFCRDGRAVDRAAWEPPVTSRVRRPQEQSRKNFDPTQGNRRCPSCNGTRVIIRGTDGTKIRCPTCLGSGEITDDPICNLCLQRFGSWAEVIGHLKVHESPNAVTDEDVDGRVGTSEVPQ